MEKDKGRSGHRRRVKDKVLRYGIESLYDYEFLELCLYYVHKQIDTKPIAKSLLDKFKCLENVCNAPEEELTAITGVGKSTVELLRMLPLICKGYAMHTSIRKRDVYDRKTDIENRCIALLSGSVNEKAYLLCFDDAKHLIKEAEISEGEPGGVNISVRKMMDAIANTATTAVVLCHNHPSGILIASDEDFRATRDVKNFLESANIEFISHYIIADGKAVECISAD